MTSGYCIICQATIGFNQIGLCVNCKKERCEDYLPVKKISIDLSFECPHCNVEHTVNLNFIKKHDYKIRCTLCARGMSMDRIEVIKNGNKK